MSISKPIHPDFLQFLELKDQQLIDLYKATRNLILELAPESNELLYHTHALSSVYSVSEKLGDAFCMIPIYTAHLNLGFNRGALLSDPSGLLQGTGKLIRHIPIVSIQELRSKAIQHLIIEAERFSRTDMDKPSQTKGKTISKIK